MADAALVGATREFTSLNEDFLSSVQDAMQESPDSCLAPLAMEYLENVFEALVKKSPKLLANGQTWEQYAASKDFTVVAMFFQGIKSGQFEAPSQTSSISSYSLNGVDQSGSTNTSKGISTTTASTFKPPSAQQERNKTSLTTFTTADPNLGKRSDSGGGNDNIVPLGGFPTSAAGKPFTFGGATNVTPPATATSTEKVTSAPPATVASTPTFTFGNAAKTDSSTTFSFGSTSSNSAATTAPSTSSAFKFGNSASTPSTFTFGGAGANTTTASGTTTPGFSFSLPQPGSSFGTSGATPGFSFGTNFAKPPSVPLNGTSETKDKEGSDDEEPPKPDHKPVEEEDALFTQRLKLFELDSGKYKDLGVGNLFIKKIASGKHQLVIRADNSLGSIILNTVLNESMPMKMLKPANILVTVPVADGKPKTYVFRVKTAEMGEDTLKQLEKYKADS